MLVDKELTVQLPTGSTYGQLSNEPRLQLLLARDSVLLDRNLSIIYADKLLTITFQLIHTIRPYNAYNNAIVEEFIENTKFERLHSGATAPAALAASRPAAVGLRQTSERDPSVAAAPLREPNSILLMKLLLRARIDLLTRVHAVLERDNQTLEGLGEEQTRQIDRLRRVYEDLFMRIGHMEKILQLRTVQLIELKQRVDSAQVVSTDGTFVWNIDQVHFKNNSRHGY